jgi:CRP-like cAMP-binding protein
VTVKKRALPMTSPAHLAHSGNTLLAALPQATLTGLEFLRVAQSQGEVCFDAGDLIERVYFPTAGLISLVISTEKGELIETGTVGHDGAAGLQSALGQRFSFPRAVVQIPGTFYVVSAEALRRAVAANEKAKALVQEYIETLWAEAQQIAACNASHDAPERVARWLLQCADRTRTEQLALTQEFLAEMLGVRRTTVTLLAQHLQDRGIIKYSRGKIAIIDRPALELCACDCYRAVKGLYGELTARIQKQSSLEARDRSDWLGP